ncbi:prephenate dehydrogenase [Microbacterium sp. SA39]|nr:prephenate dehydrogenase [Microbacterium sp. SA39]
METEGLINRVAILGAGRVGTSIARTLIDAGYNVTLAGSGDPENVEMIAAITAPGAAARWAREATADADLVVLALPLHRLPTVDTAMLADRLVIDAMNYWPPVDGTIAAFEDAATGSSVVVREMLQISRLVKTFNHTGYHDLEPDRRPSGHPERLGMAVAGDSPQDVAVVAELIDRIGYDPVALDRLELGWQLQPGNPLFGARPTADDIRAVTSPVFDVA